MFPTGDKGTPQLNFLRARPPPHSDRAVWRREQTGSPAAGPHRRAPADRSSLRIGSSIGDQQEGKPLQAIRDADACGLYVWTLDTCSSSLVCETRSEIRKAGMGIVPNMILPRYREPARKRSVPHGFGPVFTAVKAGWLERSNSGSDLSRWQERAAQKSGT